MGQMVELDNGEFAAYVAEPGGPVRGGLIVIHEVWGLVDHIRDVADRFAAQGYWVVAPDLLSRVGLPPEVGAELQRLRISSDPDEQTRAQPLLREKMAPIREPEYAEWAVAALVRVTAYVSQRAGVDGRLAVTGFCFGGSYSFALAAADARIRLAIPFYGAPPDLREVGAISCPVLAFYGDQDTRIVDGLPDVQASMAAAGIDFTAQVYPGVGHAFFNDANPVAYDENAAADAWQRTLDRLDRTLNPLDAPNHRS